MITAASPARLSWRDAAGITAGLEALAVAVWLVPASVHIVNWSASRPSRVALFAPWTRLLWLVAAALAVSAFLIAWGRRTGICGRVNSAVAPFCLLGLWAVPYLPWLADRVPLLLVLAGPIRWVIAATAMLGAVGIGARLNNVVSDTRRLPDRRLVFVASLAVYAGLGALNARMVGPGGDEPHYLIISQSLLADGDLRIENNHRQRDYREFWSGDLRPDYMKRGLNGEIYSIHAPGLPVLILPAYAAAGYFGTVMVLCLLAALAALAIFDLAEALAGRRAALVTWAAVCLTVPFVPYSWLVFPELPGALVVAWAALWLWQEAEPPTIAWAWRGVALGALPWLHTKFVILLAMFGAALFWRARTRPRALLALLTPIVLSVAGWLFFFYTIYGSVNPEAPYGDYAATYVVAKNIPRGLLGLMVDQKFGLLVYSPIYLFAIAGCWTVLRRQDLRFVGAVLFLVTAAYVGSTTRLYLWWGGTSAPARFLVPILPCLAPMIALGVGAAHGRVARTLLWMWLPVSLLIAFVGVGWPERFFLFSDAHGYARLPETIQSGAPLTLSLPTFTNEDWRSPLAELLPWVAAGGLALAALAVAARSPRVSGFWLGVVGSLTFLLTAGVVARRPSTEAREDIARQGALDLLWQYDGGRLRTFEYDRLGRSDAGRPHGLSPVTFQHYPAAAFALPQGAYQARVWFSGALQRQGELVVSSPQRVTFGREAGVFANPAVVPFELPVGVEGLSVVVSDQSLAATVSRIEIVPLAIVSQSTREPRPARTIEGLGARPGAYIVYVDAHAYPEGGVFWTRATELATVLVAPGGASRILLTLHLGPQSGDVKVSLAGKETTVRVEADRTAEVQLAVPDGLRLVPITVESTTSFRPADVNPASDDTRPLGCQVRVSLE